MAIDGSLKLNIEDIDLLATRIEEMYLAWNNQRNSALLMGQEVRSMIFATDIDSTSSSNLDTKNRTHIPKLTELSDTLQSQYWDTIFGEEKFFIFNGVTPQDKQKAMKIEAWVRSKLETKKFRQKVGRELIADYVIYGNAFFEVDYIVELDDFNNTTFKGIVVRRISPLDIVFDAEASSFKEAAKIQTRRIHLADLGNLPVKYPTLNFNKKLINKIIKNRQTGYIADWVDILHEQNIRMDGYNSNENYYKQELTTVRVYKGDIFNPKDGTVQKNRIVWTVDGIHTILNMANPISQGSDGVHHVGWRQRPDNLWGQGALDNLAGMQYRVNKVENSKADILDVCGRPITIYQGNVSLEDPANLYAAGNVIELDLEAKISFESPNPIILQYGDQHIAQYFKLMEDFAGAAPEERGIRTPGEKTKAEYQGLAASRSNLFRDKSKLFETELEEALLDAFKLTLLKYDGTDYIDIFNDVEGENELQELALEDIKALGTFTAMGSKHWDRKNKRKVELDSLIATVFKDPKYSPHVSAWELMQTINSDYELKETGIIEQYKGIKEDVAVQAVAQAEGQQIAMQTGQSPAGQSPQQQGQPTGQQPQGQ